MKFKEFVQWCNDRACDGCWGIKEFVICKSIGDSSNGYRMMYCSGNGKPPRIEVETWEEKIGWYKIGVYYPKYCPNCGREIREYERA